MAHALLGHKRIANSDEPRFPVVRSSREHAAGAAVQKKIVNSFGHNLLGRAIQRVNVDFPVDLLREIDQEARRLGVTRQAFIKVRLADSLAKNQ